MALDHAALLEVLEAMKVAEVDDRIRTAAQTIYQALIDAELTAFVGAGPWERTDQRTAQRNGYRERTLSTTAGDLELRIGKLRSGPAFFPCLLERRRRIDQALFAVVMEAYLHGVSTRKVDDLVKALGADTGISKSEVSRICADLDKEVGAFRDRSLADQSFPYVFLDATYCKARVNRRVVSQAVVIATGVAADGRREVLGFDVGDSEDGAFWTAFLRSLKARGLNGVQLVISDAHQGLKNAVSSVLLGAAWQRCRPLPTQRAGPGPQGLGRHGRRRDPHDLRPTRRRARPRAVRADRDHARPTVAQGRGDDARGTRGPARLHRVSSGALEEDLVDQPTRTTQQGGQAPHRVVGGFPNPAALRRLAGAVLVEAHDEWQVSAERRYLSEHSMTLLTDKTREEVAKPELMTA
jgi:putative transposase